MKPQMKFTDTKGARSGRTQTCSQTKKIKKINKIKSLPDYLALP